MSRFYANITLQGAEASDVVAFLNRRGEAAYVSGEIKGGVVVFHAELGGQEDLAAALSGHFHCPALLVMDYGGSILLYHLYQDGRQTDAYVSEPHDDLETGGQEMPKGNAEALCAAFGMEHRLASVKRVLRRPTDPAKGYALSVNRHGELARALNLPTIAAGASFRAIEVGELPSGPGFDPAGLVRTGAG